MRFIAQHIKDADKDNEVRFSANPEACVLTVNHILVQRGSPSNSWVFSGKFHSEIHKLGTVVVLDEC